MPFDPRDSECVECGRPFRRFPGMGPRCYWCQKEWELRKADCEADDEDRMEECRARMRRLEAEQ